MARSFYVMLRGEVIACGWGSIYTPERMSAPFAPTTELPLPTDLYEIEALAWRHLVHAVVDRKHGFHLTVMATADLAGNPDMRTVVLRHVDPERRTILIHTDVRSPKVSTIAARPATAWLFYDSTHRMQLRVHAESSLAPQEIIDRQWAASTLSSKRCYLAPRTPSSVADEMDVNLPTGLAGANPNEAESQAGRVNFTVVSSVVKSIEVLHLAASGHVRAAFDYEGNAVKNARWLRA
jgi:pyridoxamine 5'-phosphate oxidase